MAVLRPGCIVGTRLGTSAEAGVKRCIQAAV
jgi:hypothetical protein